MGTAGSEEDICIAPVKSAKESEVSLPLSAIIHPSFPTIVWVSTSLCGCDGGFRFLHNVQQIGGGSWELCQL